MVIDSNIRPEAARASAWIRSRSILGSALDTFFSGFQGRPLGEPGQGLFQLGGQAEEQGLLSERSDELDAAGQPVCGPGKGY